MYSCSLSHTMHFRRILNVRNSGSMQARAQGPKLGKKTSLGATSVHGPGPMSPHFCPMTQRKTVVHWIDFGTPYVLNEMKHWWKPWNLIYSKMGFGFGRSKCSFQLGMPYGNFYSSRKCEIQRRNKTICCSTNSRNLIDLTVHYGKVKLLSASYKS